MQVLRQLLARQHKISDRELRVIVFLTERRQCGRVGAVMQRHVLTRECDSVLLLQDVEQCDGERHATAQQYNCRHHIRHAHQIDKEYNDGQDKEGRGAHQVTTRQMLRHINCISGKVAQHRGVKEQVQAGKIDAVV